MSLEFVNVGDVLYANRIGTDELPKLLTVTKVTKTNIQTSSSLGVQKWNKFGYQLGIKHSCGVAPFYARVANEKMIKMIQDQQKQSTLALRLSSELEWEKLRQLPLSKLEKIKEILDEILV